MAEALNSPKDIIKYTDSKRRVVALIENLKARTGASFPAKAEKLIPRASIVIEGEPGPGINVLLERIGGGKKGKKPSRLQDGIHWFKAQFGDRISRAIANTPYSLDLVAAIAVQETYGDCWSGQFDKLPIDRLLQICVGDTKDAPGRKAFPQTKTVLLKDKNGQAIFDIARAALLDIATYNSTYGKIAKKYPNKFCHGFGIFQYDIQHAQKTDNPQFFLQQKWVDFDACLKMLLVELQAARKACHLGNKSSLTDEEQVHVAIAYNCGHFYPEKGLKQGYRTGKRYYGECVYDYLKLSEHTP